MYDEEGENREGRELCANGFHSWPVVAVFENSSSLTIGMFSVRVSWPPTFFAVVLNTCYTRHTKSRRKKKVKEKAALNLGNASESWSSGNMADVGGLIINTKCSITARWWGVTSDEPVWAKSAWKRKGRKLHTIFLMLLRLKLPALLCFCTWLADPWRVRPLLQCPVVGESSTCSLSIPGEKQSSQSLPVLCI